MMSRALVHGRRRAEEVREVAQTVAEAGLEPMQSPATALRQDWAADRGAELPAEILETKDLATLLDAVLSKAVR
jgi:3-hydroxyisobutyrate dehydrogenase